MTVTQLVSHNVKQDSQEINDEEEEEGEIVFESPNFLKMNQGMCGSKFQYFDASTYAKSFMPTNAWESNDIKRPCFSENLNKLYSCHLLYHNNYSSSFSKHSFLPVPTLENSFVSPTDMGDMAMCIPCENETDLNQNVLQEPSLYRNSMYTHFISVWIVMKEFDFSIIFNAVKKATFCFTVKSFNHRQYGCFFIFYFKSNMDAHLASQALTHLTFVFSSTKNGYTIQPFNFSGINQVAPLTFQLVQPFNKNKTNGLGEPLTLSLPQNSDSYNGSGRHTQKEKVQRVKHAINKSTYDMSNGMYCSNEETKTEEIMEEKDISLTKSLPCRVIGNSDYSLTNKLNDEFLQQASCGFNDMKQNACVEVMPLSYQQLIDSMEKGYGSSEEGFEILKYHLPRCLTNPILKNLYLSLNSKKHHVHFPTSYWCEHATFNDQTKDYENLLHHYTLKNRYLLFHNLPNELSSTNALKFYFTSKGLELQNFQMEIVDQKSNTVTAHVAFKTKKEAYEAHRLLVNHSLGSDMTVQFCGPRRASHTLWIGNLTNVACEWIVSKGFNELLHNFQGLSRLRVLPEKNCAFATFETKQQAVFVRNFCHGLLFGYLGNKVRLNVDFTVSVNEVEQVPVRDDVCEFCLNRHTANEDSTVKKPFITVPPHLEFFLHDPLHVSCVDGNNSKLNIETNVPPQSFDMFDSSFVKATESGKVTIEATKDVDVTVEEKHEIVTRMEVESDELMSEGNQKTLNTNKSKLTKQMTKRIVNILKENDDQRTHSNDVDENEKNLKEMSREFKTCKESHKGLKNMKQRNEKLMIAKAKNEQGQNLNHNKKELNNGTGINNLKKDDKEGSEDKKDVHIAIDKWENATVMNDDLKDEDHPSTENPNLCLKKVRAENVNIMSEAKEISKMIFENKENVMNSTEETVNRMNKGTENVTEFIVAKESGRDKIEKKNSFSETQKRKQFLCPTFKEKNNKDKELELGTASLLCSFMETATPKYKREPLKSICLDKDNKIQAKKNEETKPDVQHTQGNKDRTEQLEKMCNKKKQRSSKYPWLENKMSSSVVGNDGLEVSSKKTTDLKTLSTECGLGRDTNDVKVRKQNQNNVMSKARNTKKLLPIEGFQTKKVPLTQAKRAVCFSGTKTVEMEGISSYNSCEMKNMTHCVNGKNETENVTSRKTHKHQCRVKTVNQNLRIKQNQEHASVVEKGTFQKKTKYSLKNKVVKWRGMCAGATVRDIVVLKTNAPQKKRPFLSEEQGYATSTQEMNSGLFSHTAFLSDDNDSILIPKLKKKTTCTDSVNTIPVQKFQPPTQNLSPPLKDSVATTVDQDINVSDEIPLSQLLKSESMEIEEISSFENKTCLGHKVEEQAFCIQDNKEIKQVPLEIEPAPFHDNLKEEKEENMGNPVMRVPMFQKSDWPRLKNKNFLKRESLLNKSVHLKHTHGLEKQDLHITSAAQKSFLKKNTIELFTEEKKEKVQQNNLSSIVKGTCQLMKQGQFVCFVNYQYKQGKIERNLPTILDVSARTTITILYERVQQKCHELTIWQLVPLEDTTPYETLCDYFKSRDRIGLVESCKKTIFLVPLKDSSEILNLHVNKMTLFAVVIHGCLLKPKENS
ncbi:uncharacterized protein LOC128883329 isoform X3 [Hylaeus volcanicus]|uniref:uncharacterized protein LOC128883329 isoform X3 n=1 Tax=Hylaeus volcanicus TaxID=313075 RepID=UPI0023B77A0A|nr:uncharacterized protein LOC128883329 isoform X3 [Hylaeus volcanicus]